MLRILITIIIAPVLAVLTWLALGEHAARPDFVVASQEPRTLDPHRVSWIAEIQLANTLFEGLTRLNSDTFQPEPAVAQSWSVAPKLTTARVCQALPRASCHPKRSGSKRRTSTRCAYG